MILRCPICGDDFQPRNFRVRCCSSGCGDKLYYIENRAEIIAKVKEHKRSPRNRSKHNEYMREYMKGYRRRKAAERAAVSRS